jgi:hypothetical protein
MAANYKIPHREWVEQSVRNADHFVVRLFLGVGQYDTREAATLGDARRLRRQMIEEWKEHNPHRRPNIYVVTKGVPMTVHVE